MDNLEKLATRRGNQEWTIQRNWKHWPQKAQDEDKKHNPICVGHHYTQANTNETWAVLQTKQAGQYRLG